MTRYNKVFSQSFVAMLFLAFLNFSCGQAQNSELNSQAIFNEANTTPTMWWWYHGKTGSELSALVKEKGARIVDLEVESTNPLKFAATLVKNTGTHKQGWWWYYGQTSTSLKAKLKEKNARIVNLQSYQSSGTKFAVILAPNTGSSAKSWWWYHGLTSGQVSEKIKEKGARIIDIKTYGSGSSKRFSIAMIKNSGSDARGWWWYHGQTSSGISSKLRTNKAILVDVERESDGKFTAVMIRPKKSYKWWWYQGQSSSALTRNIAQNGARLERITTWGSGRSKRFAAIMVDNSNAITSRVGSIARSTTTKYNGAISFYLKRVGGPQVASLYSTRSFEPASSLKALHLYAASKDISEGKRSLGDMIAWSSLSSRTDNPSTTVDEAKDGCMTNFPPNSQISLQNALSQMMQISDNRTTEAVRRLFGYNGLNSIANSLGMSSTRVNHMIGCGGPTRNRFATRDASKLYEAAINGSELNRAGRDAFWGAMQTGLGGLPTIINQEITKYVNSRTDLSSSEKQAKITELNTDFRSRVRRFSKGGSYTLCQGNTSNCFPREVVRSRAGRVMIPVKLRGRITFQQYTYGVFLDSAIVNTTAQETETANGQATTERELFREVIANALKTFK